MIYPDEEREALARWMAVRSRLAPRIRVPEVLADDRDAVQILEDFGSVPFSAAWQSADPPSRQRILVAAAAVAAAVAATEDPGVNPPFTAEFFERELGRSRESVFDRYFRQPLSPDERSVHDEFARAISREIARHPVNFVHRDFHADNIFVLGDGSIGLIDFQDARAGPDSYDIASLCRERATLLKPDLEAERAAAAAFATGARRVAGFSDRIARVRLQRAWKACGTFAAAASEGRTTAYEEFLPETLSLTSDLLARTGPEHEFRAILGRRSAKLFGGGR